MKKNKSMRAAGGLLIATMLTSSIVSGTYAKYVTSDEAKDTARVAKFGVTVTASGSLFDTTYKAVSGGNTPGGKNATDSEDGTTLTVESFAEAGQKADNVVAPGTKNDKGLTFAIAGTPEVDVAVKIEIDNTSDIWLGSGTYPNMTNGDVFDDTYNADNDIFTTSAYYPIKYTLKQNNNEIATGNLDTIIKKLNSTFNGINTEQTVYDANTDLSTKLGTFQLTWEWDYENATDENIDKADTLLGDLAAGNVNSAITAINNAGGDISALTAGKGVVALNNQYNLNTNLNIKVTVTQVD